MSDKASLAESGLFEGDMPPPLDAEKASVHSSPSQHDTITVDWDGPDDPENPLNWSRKKSAAQMAIVGAVLLLVNLSATMFAPGAALLMKDFHSTNSTLATLTVSIFLLGFALGPLMLAPLSELYGRLIIYYSTTFVFLAFTLACGASTNLGMFLAFRFIAGSAGSAPMALGGGTLADVIPLEERGKWMGILVLGPLLGPVIGPIAGGFVAQDIGWRWAFWIIAIAGGVFFTLLVTFMRESHAPTLLRRKAARLNKEAGKEIYVVEVDGPSNLPPSTLLTISLTRPLKLLIFSPTVLLSSLYAAFMFGVLFLLFTTFTSVFEDQYGFSTGTVGLSYLGLGIGMLSGVLTFTKMSDRILKKRKAKNGKNKPEDRLPLMALLSPAIPIGLFWYGWSAEEKVHWIVPILGTVLIGFGIVFILMTVMVYLVDTFGAKAAASSLAANTLLRSLFGAFLPLAGPKMYEALGFGWGNSVLGFIAVAFIPVPWLFSIYGERIRTRWQVKF